MSLHLLARSGGGGFKGGKGKGFKGGFKGGFDCKGKGFGGKGCECDASSRETSDPLDFGRSAQHITTSGPRVVSIAVLGLKCGALALSWCY